MIKLEPIVGTRLLALATSCGPIRVIAPAMVERRELITFGQR